MIALLDPRIWLVGLGVALAAYGTGRMQQYSADKDAQAAAVLTAVERARAEFAERVEQQQEIARHATKNAEAARADARAAAAAADSVRKRAAAAANDPAIAACRQAAGDPIGVLADVLGRADERAGILAAYADQARIAGLACEQSYDALIKRASERRGTSSTP